MFGYYLTLALRSLRRNPALTVLMVLAIGVGIGASMTTLPIFRAMSGDPIPQKSRQLFTPQIDNYGPALANSAGSALPGDRLPRALTYTDAVALMRAHAAEHQAAMYTTSVVVAPPNPEDLPLQAPVRATYTDFFTMFDVPFEYGAPWSAADDAAGAPVVVLSRQLNDKLFGGINSVGRSVTLNDEKYQVAGVIQAWAPAPRFYDLRENTWGPEQMFIPFTTAIARELPNRGAIACPRSPGTGKDALLHSECTGMQMWVELPNAAEVRAYRNFLTNYAAQQRQVGRFNWTPRIALRNVRQWLVYNNVVSDDLSVLVLLSFAFLLVCVLNGVGLMLAKFMARAPQVNVRRALGANNGAIFKQCLVEAGMIGLAGGVVGIGLSTLGLLLAQGLFIGPAGAVAASLTRLDGRDVIIAVVLGIGSALLAGLYPTWRATRISARRRNRIGAALIALQIAVALAILCNAAFIVQRHLARAARPSGVDEVHDFAVESQWVGSPPDLGSRIRADVAALRAIPTVADAFETNFQPLNDDAMTLPITLHPDQQSSTRLAAAYFGDEHAMDTLGFKLSAGRNFSASEITDWHGMLDRPATSGILVTRILARQLAPGGEVLGRVATLGPIRAPIVGIIDRLQIPPANIPGNEFLLENSIVMPYRFLNPSWSYYIVRAKPGGLAQAMTAVPAALARVSRQRAILKIQSLAESRRVIYRGDRTQALMLSLVCLILLAVTAFGIVGLTSYWVSQRRHQIGIRRALGATRLAIMQYFQIENLLITVGGIVVGVALAVSGNLWIVNNFAMERLPYEYLIVGVVALLVLGQLAVLWPALRAASVPPAEATRTV